MLLSSKNDKSDGKKIFEGLFFLYQVASNLFIQTKTFIDKGSVLWFIS